MPRPIRSRLRPALCLPALLLIAFSLFALSLFAPQPLAAQNRSRMTVYFPMPTGGTDGQKEYFHVMFGQELIGANYPQADDKEGSMFTLYLSIVANEEFDSSSPPDMTYNPPLFLGVKLDHSADDSEIINFDFPFVSTDSMSDWNLYLLYQAMANAYVPDDTPPEPPEPPEPPPTAVTVVTTATAERDDRWRNKWLYINMALGADMGYFLRAGTMLTDQGYMAPLFLAGLELQFFDFLSFELDPLSLHLLHDSNEYMFAPDAAAMLKAILKPGDHLMLEPYAGAEFTLTIPSFSLDLPWLWAFAGMQFCTHAGPRGGFTLDLRASYNILGEIQLPMRRASAYSTLRFSLMAGFKFGYWDRKRDSGK